jgi:hypothetical protein
MFVYVLQALAQCEQTLTKLGIEHREAVDDTAGAAKVPCLFRVSCYTESVNLCSF